MIKIKTTLNIRRFGGIDRTDTHTNPEGTYDLKNLRVGEDGSLHLRDGSRRLCNVISTVRDIWSGVLWGAFHCFVLAGVNIFDVKANGSMVAVARLNSDGEASFFYYRKSLYIVDGTGIYRLLQGSLEEPHGYVPLVAKNWSDNMLGEINEPHNLLNKHGRLEYTISESGSGMLLLDDFIDAVDALYLNGTLLPSNRYTVGSSSPYITVGGVSSGDRVSIYVTYRDAAPGLEALKKNRRAEVFGGINTSRPFLFGGEDASVMYSSAYVSEDSLAASQSVYPQSDALYFPEGYEFIVGDGTYGITAVGRHYDRLLIFTEGGTWQADSSACGTEPFPVMNVNSTVGVISHGGVALLGNSPCAVSKDGIYRFTADTDELNDCNAYCISDKISPLLSKEFLEGARVFSDKTRGELLFCNPAASERTLVYSERTRTWTSFVGIAADRFFDLNGTLAYTSGTYIYVFDSTLDTDKGIAIEPYFESNLLCTHGTRSAHLRSVEVCFDGDGLCAAVSLDKGERTVGLDIESEGGSHTAAKKRVQSGRFKTLSVSISSDGSLQALHSLTVNTR